jgi:hypothetical protein
VRNHKVVLIPFILLALVLSQNTALATNWHSGYKYHDTSLGFDIYWKWNDITSMKNDSAAINAVASVPVTELCAVLVQKWSGNAVEDQTDLYSPYTNFNGLPAHENTGMLMFGIEKGYWAYMTGNYLHKHLIRTSVKFVKCSNVYPDGYSRKGVWNGVFFNR